MGRPPANGGPVFRFTPAEVAEMETILRSQNASLPSREHLEALAEKFSNSSERSGKVAIQWKQVWNWFQNRRYAIRAKTVKSPVKPEVSPIPRDISTTSKIVPQAPPTIPAAAASQTFPQALQQPSASSGRNGSDSSLLEYEAKSARDGAWYDVHLFLSHRAIDTGDPEVLVRFSGFGPEEDEWLNVRKHVRQRSSPCESAECVAVLPGDLILCFQEGKDQALYFDAHVLDAQRRRHDARGCRCRFLVRYDHDQSEEIVALRKICRRPETEYRLRQLNAVNEATTMNQNKPASNIHTGSSLRVYPPAEVTVKPNKVENMPPAPPRISGSEVTETKVQQPVMPVPHTNVPEIKVEQPGVLVSHAKAPERPDSKSLQPTEHSYTNSSGITDDTARQHDDSNPCTVTAEEVDTKDQQPVDNANSTEQEMTDAQQPEDPSSINAQEMTVTQQPMEPLSAETPEMTTAKASQPMEPVSHTNAHEIADSKVQQSVESAPRTDAPELTRIEVELPESAKIVNAGTSGNLDVPPGFVPLATGPKSITATDDIKENMPADSVVTSETAASTGGSGDGMQIG